MELMRITYTSKLIAKTPQIAEKHITQILRAANRYNPSVGIGGMLVYNKKTYELFQVLEGPVDRVKNLYRTITNDNRHTGCIILKSEVTEDVRKFTSFGMAVCKDQVVTKEEFLELVYSVTFDNDVSKLCANGDNQVTSFTASKVKYDL